MAKTVPVMARMSTSASPVCSKVRAACKKMSHLAAHSSIRRDVPGATRRRSGWKEAAEESALSEGGDLRRSSWSDRRTSRAC